MASRESVYCLISRIIGVFELVIALFFLGVFSWSTVRMWGTFANCSHCVVVTAFVGIYVLASLIVSTLLIVSTFPAIMSISSRKWIAVSSCALSTSGLIAGTIFSCVAPGVFSKHLEGYFVMAGLLLKCTALVCLVCKYVWVFTELLSDTGSGSSKINANIQEQKTVPVEKK